MNALLSLTRDADASQTWRLVGWLAVVFIPFLAGGMLSNAAQLLNQYALADMTSSVIFIALAVVAIALSFAPRLLTLALTAVGVLISLVLANLSVTGTAEWQVTPVEFSEWGSATVLALVASGLGLGLYWQNSLAQVQQQDAATKTVLPIWIAQILAVVAFAFFAVQAALPAYAIALTAVAAAREQLAQRQLNIVIQWLVLLAATLVWLIPATGPIFNILLMLWGLVICLIYAIFAGWIMKISHLRKSMNFSNEVFYNIWRIAVRVVLPVSIVLAIVAVLGKLI